VVQLKTEVAMISVIIPVYNEEKVIAKILHDLKSVMDNNFKGYEIIIVNDGSTDRTAEILGKEKGGVVSVLTHPENIGYGKSLLDGIIAAKNECVAIIDADGSYSVQDIRSLYQYYPRYDMVVGAREGKEYRRGLFKRPARILFQYLVEYAAGRKVQDVNSGLRIFKKSIVLQFEDSLCSGFSFTTTLTLIFLLNKYYVKYFPISYMHREGKSKIRHFRDTLRSGQIIVGAILYYNPVKLFLLIATFSASFGVVLGALNHLFFQRNMILITAAICVANFIPIFCIGLISDQLKKIYNLYKHSK